MLQHFTDKIVTRKLNDPSRDFPGDVQGLASDGTPEITLEARNKLVSESDAMAFIESCSRQGINRAIILELTGRPTKLRLTSLISDAWSRFGVALLVIDNLADLVAISATLGKMRPDEFYANFARVFSNCLAQVEAPEAARIMWATYVEGDNPLSVGVHEGPLRLG